MGSCYKPSLPLVLLQFILCLLLVCTSDAEVSEKPRALNNTISAVFVFGDSTVDPGNNNYLPTAFKGNFAPYGRDFTNRNPTGRFTNGRLTTDFIASYVGVKNSVPPYLDSRLSSEELMTGVSFASAGSGFDPLTPRIPNVMDIQKQLECFRAYKQKLESATGKQRTEDHIKKALFIISAGTNDFVINYFALPFRRKNYSVFTYQKFILHKAKELLQALHDEGARKILMVGLPPMGCLPIVITLSSNNAILSRDCIEAYSIVARDYNLMLQNELNFMQQSLGHAGTRINYIDIYGPIEYMIQGPGKFDFDEVSSGCCGTGYLEAAFLCNPDSYVCPDASTYVFWDSIHPTEKTYYNVFKSLLPIIDSFIRE
ncbi:GDSL-motif lipase/hydrolase family protein [Tripterygium wilfordii]|uniref:GDSL-motif lipase/hydrolase family protein n=2 Tax=Tripterygium wilfordii TaxID=458696 RepID=A0A7J7C4U9_TRIWF|nr:GDSL-motif lipase/hydrolase family protein [Tripterygium wilfordii]